MLTVFATVILTAGEIDAKEMAAFVIVIVIIVIAIAV
jgi:hypothetical protein